MKSIRLFILSIIFFNNSHAQLADYFQFTAPKEKAVTGSYKKIHFLDSRRDTNDLGHVYAGKANRRLPVVAATDLPAQCNQLLQYVCDSTSKNNTLVFQLRKFEFDELPDAFSGQNGSCCLRADIYYQLDNRYFRIARLDTLLRVQDNHDVTPLLFEHTSAAVAAFLRQNAGSYLVPGTSYTYREILNIDSVEKSRSALFSQSRLNAGAYLSFAAFKKQAPDFKIVDVNTRFGEIKSVTVLNEAGKKRTLFVNDMYALVHNENAFVRKDSKLYMLQKADDDFYFAANLQVPPVDLGLDLSPASALYYSKDRIRMEKQLNGPFYARYKLKLDAVDGSFITLNKLIQ